MLGIPAPFASTRSAFPCRQFDRLPHCTPPRGRQAKLRRSLSCRSIDKRACQQRTNRMSDDLPRNVVIQEALGHYRSQQPVRSTVRPDLGSGADSSISISQPLSLNEVAVTPGRDGTVLVHQQSGPLRISLPFRGMRRQAALWGEAPPPKVQAASTADGVLEGLSHPEHQARVRSNSPGK